MAVKTRNLWSLALDHQWIDPEALADAIQEEVAHGELDYRTRLLIKECTAGLRRAWGDDRYDNWTDQFPRRDVLEGIGKEVFTGEFGFPYLQESIMEPTRPETIKQFLRELSDHVPRPLRLYVAGSVALILPGYLSKRTTDIDVVDEVPPELRQQHQLLSDLAKRYRLELGHMQSHYLPMGWRDRAHSQTPMGQLQVFLVDRYDVALSKLFSARAKDLDDYVRLLPDFDKDIFVHKLKESTQSLLAVPDLRQKAEKNWFILYGEALPS